MKFSAPNPTGRGKYCQYYAGVYMGNPRLVLQTNDPSEVQDKAKGFGRIEAAMDLPTFMAAMTLLRNLGEETLAAIRSGAKDTLKEVKYSIECLSSRGQGGSPGQMPPPVLVTTLHIGRDLQGVIYVSNISADAGRPKVKVPLTLPDKRFHVISADRQPLEPSYLSAVCAIAFANIWTNLMPETCQRTFVPPVFGGGGGGGGGNRNFQRGGGNNGGQRPYQNNQPARQEAASTEGASADFGDDIPF